jgi:hypothetical protein
MTAPKAVFMPHANLQYSQLDPARRAWVIENSYRPLLELVEQGGYRLAFEASGRTLEIMAREAPAVLDRLRRLIQAGQIEPVASPFTHIMLANVPEEVGLATLRHGLDAWEQHTGARPETGWNPECGWAGFVPEIYKAAGFRRLIMDGDSFLLSYPAIRAATGLAYDVRGHSNKSHLFRIEAYIRDKPEYLRWLTNASLAPNGLELIFRSDCLANPMLWYLMGATEGMRDKPVSLDEIRDALLAWKDRIAVSGTFIMPYAEDAEYIGTSAYFYVKQFHQSRFFEPEPVSVSRFRQLLDTARELGYELALPREVAAGGGNRLVNDRIDRIENGVAWHGGTAKAWANTLYSRLLDPVCLSVLNGIRALAAARNTPLDALDGKLRDALRALTNAWVSDARWPPPPTSPGRFNVREALDDLRLANRLAWEHMRQAGLGERLALYSPPLMETQILAVEQELMEMAYFGEVG